MSTPGERLKLVFCGTPQFAVPTLEALIAAGHQVELVVSQPDRPVGRAQTLTAPPVKQFALAHGIEVAQPEKIRNNPEFQARLEAMNLDAIVVVAYGKLLPPWMLNLPRLGCINLHASLLPKYRGAAPIQWAIANGDHFTGNTTMLMDEGMDTGMVVQMHNRPIGPNETAEDISRELSVSGAKLVVQTLIRVDRSRFRLRPQNHELATYAPMLKREDGRMDFAARSARELYDRWRGFQPWPGAFTMLEGKKLIVHRMAVAVERGLVPSASAEPGVVRVEDGHLLAACARNTWLELLELQLEGKKRMTAAEFLRGASLGPNTRLG
jgi:methionyl-tRNA formyltransferase